MINKTFLKKFNILLRKIKINSLLEKELVLSINENNLFRERLNLIKVLSKFGVITGSTLYSLYGLITRMPIDIDLLIDKKGLEFINKHYKIIKHDQYTDNKINSIGYLIINEDMVNWDIDLFLIDDISKYKTVNNIRIDNILYSIIKKIEIYKNNSNRNQYDITDLLEIYQCLKYNENFSEKIQKQLILLKNYNSSTFDKLLDKIKNIF